MQRMSSYTWLATVGLMACSASEHPGPEDALLALHGAIDLQGSKLEAPVGLAVAFGNDSGNALYLARGETGGTFPSSFTFELTEPPPRESLFRLEGKEPQLAFGWLTAVGVDAPSSLRIANSQFGTGGCSATECTSSDEWCSQGNDPADDVCYSEQQTCDLNRENCTTISEGDVSLKSGPWEQIAGVSTNYLVLYLSRGVSANSFTALAFSEGVALSAGYHLLAISARTEAELDAQEACFEQSEQRALAQYNQRHGTQYSNTLDLPDEAYEDYDVLFSAAQLALRCAQTNERYTPVEDPDAMPIAIQLSRDDRGFSL